MFAVQRAEFRGGYTRDMPENKKTTINYQADTSTSVFLILIFLFIILFWGEPDLLDMAIMWMGR